MSTIFDDDIIVHRVATPGLDGDGLDAAEAAALRADLADMLARPDVRRLLDLLDVTGTPEAGATIVYNAGDDEWQVGSVAGAIARVDDPTSTELEPNVNRVTPQRGLTAIRAGSGWVALEPLYAGSGTQNRVARADHVHPNVQVATMTIPESGSLSSGTRTLVSGNVTGLSASKTYTIKPRMVLEVQGEGVGAGYSVASVQAGSSTATRNESRHVSGVPREITLNHSGYVVTGVTSVTVTARLQYTSGDPVYVRGGRVTVDVEPES